MQGVTSKIEDFTC